METEEFQQIVAAIGDEILARVAGGESRTAAGPCSYATCSDCKEQNAEACVAKARDVVAAGADRLSCCASVGRSDPAIARLIDHTQLRPEATRADIVKLCGEARRYQFATVCVNPYWAPLAVSELAGSTVKVSTVAGFPLGANTTEVKRAEAEAAMRVGAGEIDMVINVGTLRSGNYDAVKLDIQGVVEVCRGARAVVKVILETALLDDNQKVIACTLAKMAGADFVKTSTGFGPAGASARDVALMRQAVGPEMGVKAAGGIRTIEDFKTMVAAGATRIGASASVRIVEAAA